MKRWSYVLLLILSTFQGAQAQMDDFKAFREQILNDYQDFRKNIMERYVEFLDAAWTEYETMAGSQRVTIPKPIVAPVYTPPTLPSISQKENEKPIEETKQPVVVTPMEELPKLPTNPNTPIISTIPEVPSPIVPQIRFLLYGLQLVIPAPKLEATLYNVKQQEVVAFWKQIHESDTEACVESIRQLAVNYRLGDWCTLKAVEEYCNKWAKDNEIAARVMMQYLMLSMGYDVRLAIADNMVYLLLPFEQKVYANTYIPINNVRYYIYPNTVPENSSIYSCPIPSNEVCGQKLNLIINPSYLLPKDEHTFSVSYGGLSAQGSVNKNVIALQQQYPLMDIHCYAASVADESVKESVVKQLSAQVAGMNEGEAANALLHFVQNGFKYQTDQQQFGDEVMEKIFFFDEILYFPYCDCEDRSIFYAYLVRKILGLDVLLVGYPGHECTAVALSVAPPSYTSFIYKGKTFYICDPTYIGANIGMCMPNYTNEKPKVEEWY
ncbi:MAG: hypothetical protein IKA75_06685 [Bacteroidaceae bacterium]|nr:hypothetical protein [Bacteroidaceae bacterium]